MSQLLSKLLRFGFKEAAAKIKLRECNETAAVEAWDRFESGKQFLDSEGRRYFSAPIKLSKRRTY